MYNVTGIDESAETVQVIQPSEDLPEKQKFRPHWERRLPAKLVVAPLDESNESPSPSLKLKVSIETSDTGASQVCGCPHGFWSHWPLHRPGLCQN